MDCNRRNFLAALAAGATPMRASTADNVEAAHGELWKRFIETRHFTLLDYADLDGKVFYPTGDEIRQAKPNALVWGAPIENAAFFGGLYLDALCNRWRVLRTKAAAADARRIVAGLLALAPRDAVPGFVGRGFAEDGSLPLAGSDDQTFPWVYGLWRYVNSPIPKKDERAKLVERIVELVTAVERNGWRMPCNRAGFGNRGSWVEANYVLATRLLFAYRAMHQLTGDKRWLDGYRQRLREPLDGTTRYALCEQGAQYGEVGSRTGYPINPEFWTTTSCQAALRALVELEDDPATRDAFRRGLETNARNAAPHIERYRNFDNADRSVFHNDWRFLNELWQPQPDVPTAVAVAEKQIREWNRRSPRRVYEARHMREPFFAAWIAMLSGNREIMAKAAPALEAALAHFRWGSLYTSLFFAAEGAYYQWKS